MSKKKQIGKTAKAAARPKAASATKDVKRRPAAAAADSGPSKRGKSATETTPRRSGKDLSEVMIMEKVMPAFEEKLHAALNERLPPLVSGSSAAAGKSSAERRAREAEAELKARADKESESQQRANQAELRAIQAEERAARLEGVVSVLERQAAQAAEAQQQAQEAEQRAARAEGAMRELRQVHGGFMSWVMSVASSLENGGDSRQPRLQDIISKAKAEMEDDERREDQANMACTPPSNSHEPHEPPLPKAITDASQESAGSASKDGQNLRQQPLPPGWQYLKSSRTGREFFWNPMLKRSQWERPT